MMSQQIITVRTGGTWKMLNAPSSMNSVII